MSARRAVILALAVACLEGVLPGRAARAAQSMREGQAPLEAGRFKSLLELAPIHVGAPNDLAHLIAFFDPNCPWCAKLWTRLYGNANALASAWIPVPYMKSSSAGRAAAILRASVPATALAANFASYDARAKTGGIEPVPDVSASERSRFSRYIAAWAALTPATPLMVYVNGDGLTYRQVGLPPQDAFDALLRDLPSGKLSAFP
jgi:thiol:disulfide interchange protein DsbG